MGTGTLAAVKRKIKVGTVLVMVEHTTAQALCPMERVVMKVQSNGIGMTPMNKRNPGPSWVYWPKAANVEVRTDERGEVTGFTVIDPEWPRTPLRMGYDFKE